MIKNNNNKNVGRNAGNAIETELTITKQVSEFIL